MSPSLLSEIHERVVCENASVHIVAPALNSRLRHWVSDSDAAISKAQVRLDRTIENFQANGFVNVSGEVGDAYPILAIEDALAAFSAGALLISTWPMGQSNWLAHDVVEKARERFDIPVHHITAEHAVEPRVVLSLL